MLYLSFKSKLETQDSHFTFLTNILINISETFKYAQGCYKVSIYGTYSLNLKMYEKLQASGVLNSTPILYFPKLLSLISIIP